MQVKLGSTTLQKHICERAPQFYQFMKERKIYRNLVDVMFVKPHGSSECQVVTSHSDRPPIDYYILDKVGDIFLPRHITEMQLAKLDLIISRRSKNNNTFKNDTTE